MKHLNSADMRAAAVRTMDFHDESQKLQREIQDLKRARIEALLKKAVNALQYFGMKAKGSIYDPNPHRGFFQVGIDVEVLGDPVSRHEFQDILDEVLGHGWQIAKGGPDWSIEFQYPTP